MLRWKTLLTISLLFILSGCLIGDVLGSGRRNELDDSRKKWLDAGIANYTYRQDRSCFCFFAGPADVTVINREIVSVRGLWPDSIDIGSDNFNIFDTVIDLFDMVEDAIDRKVHQLDVTYDQQFGYPTSIAIDYQENTIDDEITITATALIPNTN